MIALGLSVAVVLWLAGRSTLRLSGGASKDYGKGGDAELSALEYRLRV